jgi:hypothetical protein
MRLWWLRGSDLSLFDDRSWFMRRHLFVFDLNSIPFMALLISLLHIYIGCCGNGYIP